MYLRLFRFLDQYKRLNVFFLLIYFLLVVLPHEKIGLWISSLFNSATRNQYNNTILSLFIFIVIVCLYFIKPYFNRHPNKSKALILLGVQVLFGFGCFYYLMIVNIEMIHIIQYAIFAMIAYPLIQNSFGVLLFTTLAGAIDEAYQYFYLSPERTDYYDFNDVIINMVGASTGLLIIYVFFPLLDKTKKWNSSLFLLYGLIGVLIYFAITFDYLWVYPTENSVHLYTFVREINPDFWTFLPSGIVYHVIKPLEGMFVIFSLFIFYGILFKNSKSGIL